MRITLALWVLLISGALSCAPTATSTPLVATPASKATAVPRETWEYEWQKTLDAARLEGKAVINTNAGAGVRGAFAKPLKEKYGVALEWVMGTGAEISQKMLTERRAGLYTGDVYMLGVPTILTVLMPAGMVDPLRPEFILPEVLDTKLWNGNRLPFSDKGEEYIFGFRGGPYLMIHINTDLVKPEEMTSYRDLLNPKFKGKIAMGDPTIPSTAANFCSIMGEYFMGYDFLRDLAKQEPFLSRNERLVVESVARGKYSILIGVVIDNVTEFQKAGAPLRTVIPNEGTVIDPGAGVISVINRRPDPNATRIFINWLLSKEGQTVYSKAAGVQSAREDVSTAHLDPLIVRDPGKKYILVNEEFKLKGDENVKRLYPEIFGPLLK